MKNPSSILTIALTAFLLAGSAASPSFAANSSASSIPVASHGSVHDGPTRPALLAESWYGKFFNALKSALRSRKRMFQFALVGMLVALWIIWWRK